jgi:pimeloyl-ACP methyl ester carboxylesterase
MACRHRSRAVRSPAGCPKALAVADHLGIGQFTAVGISTGGAFALALAALAPERVLGVVACSSMTDTRWPDGRATMSRPHVHAVWEAPDRAAALAAAT